MWVSLHGGRTAETASCPVSASLSNYLNYHPLIGEATEAAETPVRARLYDDWSLVFVPILVFSEAGINLAAPPPSSGEEGIWIA